MTAAILDGRDLAERIKREIHAEVDALKFRGVRPHLAAVQVGEPPASKVYTRFQQRACEAANIGYELIQEPLDISREDLLTRITQLNERTDVTGVILQLPLPAHIPHRLIQNAIAPAKDVEGMHALNYGRLFGATGHVAPCTALAAVELLRSTGMDLAGAEVVIVGHSEIVGKPIAMLLLQSTDRSPTVTVCHVATRDLMYHTKRADVLFVATGVRQLRWQRYHAAVGRNETPDPPDLGPLVRADMVKPGAVVIDVAINRIPVDLDRSGRPALDENGRAQMVTVGDVDFEGVKQVASAVTPVPGGVGPVTVSMLLRNTIACAKLAAETTC